MLLICGSDMTCLTLPAQGESIDIEESLASMENQAPLIATFGINMDSLTDFKVVIEGENILPMPSLSCALHCCFAAYYIYNITFPSDLKPLMLFLEKYVYNLEPSQKLPLSASIVIDSLERV